MGLNKIEERLASITAIVDGWKRQGSVPRIERDIVLEQLRAIYNEVLDVEDSGVVADQEHEPESVEPVEVESEQPVDNNGVVDEFYESLDIDALLGITDDAPQPEPEPEPEPQPEPQQVVEPEPVVEPQPEVMEEAEPVVDEEPQVVSTSGGLFNLDDIPVRTKSKRKMISLYDDAPIRRVAEPVEEHKPEPVEEHKPEPVEPFVESSVAQQPVEQPSVVVQEDVQAPQCLGDVLGGGVQTLADKMSSDDAPTTPFNRIEDLRKAIGLNDKFLMIRDLFGGDADRYEDTIDTLNEFEDLDECIIYITENFRWNPDSEGAKLLISLIERKLA
jgi:outer membrane biosynthesis protein TonB